MEKKFKGSEYFLKKIGAAKPGKLREPMENIVE